MNMKVVHILPTITPRSGGLFNSVYTLAEADLKVGAEVYILTGRESDTKSYIKRWNKFNLVVLIKTRPYKFGLMMFGIYNIFKIRPNIVHVHGIWSYHVVIAVLYKRLNPVSKLIVSPRGMAGSYSLTRSVLFKRIARMLYVDLLFRLANNVHALSANEAEECSSHFHVKGQILIHPNVLGSDSRRLSNQAYLAETIMDNKITIGFMSRIHPKKNIESILYAIYHLRLFREIRLEVYGSGSVEYIRSLVLLANELGISDLIRFHGHVNGIEKLKAYQSFNVFILNSVSEGLPMAAIEALYQGKYVIVSTSCNLQACDGLSGFEIIDGSTTELTNILSNIAKETLIKRYNRESQLNLLGFMNYQESFIRSRLYE